MAHIYVVPKVLRGKLTKDRVKKMWKEIYELRMDCRSNLFQHVLWLNYYFQEIICSGYNMRNIEMVDVLIETVPLSYFKILSVIWSKPEIENYSNLLNYYFSIYEKLDYAPWICLQYSLSISQKEYCERDNRRLRDTYIIKLNI